MYMTKESGRMYYHVSLKDLGKDPVIFKPRVPDTHMPREDTSIPRICVAPSIYGCVKAIYLPQLCENGCGTKLNDGECLPLYVYRAYIEDKDIICPSYTLVPDVDYTSEVWIMKEQEFSFYKTFKIHKQFDFPFSAYSRYAISPEDEDEVIDRINATILYGNTFENFSYIDFNPLRSSIATKYNELLQTMSLEESEKIIAEILEEKSKKNN